MIAYSKAQSYVSEDTDRTQQDYYDRYHSLVHRLPSAPKVLDYALFVPKAMYYFVARLNDGFGYKVISSHRSFDVMIIFQFM